MPCDFSIEKNGFRKLSKPISFIAGKPIILSSSHAQRSVKLAPYNRKNLVLLGVRENVTPKSLTRNSCIAFGLAKGNNIPIMATILGGLENADGILEALKSCF
jgi:hypothetical protein